MRISPFYRTSAVVKFVWAEVKDDIRDKEGLLFTNEAVISEFIDELKLGTEVMLCAEPDNPYDPNAVALVYKGKKIGYIPRVKNDFISSLLYFGYEEMLTAKINARNLEAHPEQQFRVVVRLKDNRKSE